MLRQTKENLDLPRNHRLVLLAPNRHRGKVGWKARCIPDRYRFRIDGDEVKTLVVNLPRGTQAKTNDRWIVQPHETPREFPGIAFVDGLKPLARPDNLPYEVQFGHTLHLAGETYSGSGIVTDALRIGNELHLHFDNPQYTDSVPLGCRSEEVTLYCNSIQGSPRWFWLGQPVMLS